MGGSEIFTKKHAESLVNISFQRVNVIVNNFLDFRTFVF